MDTCDVLIVGGGPAGSTCARALRRAGLDALVIDKARFPRDKICAGWITPHVVDRLELDLNDYRRRHTLQPITGFRVGIIGRDAVCDVEYDRPVSYAIRRCEFDAYLLDAAGVPCRTGEAVTTIRRQGDRWIVNGHIETPMLVGAGGHRCPVAALVSPREDVTAIVAAEEIEIAVPPDAPDGVSGERPELYLAPDLAGYGWCIRKSEYVNVGFGRVAGHALPREMRDFVRFLQSKRRIPLSFPERGRAHAYLLAPCHRQLVADAVLLVGDSAGLARPPSGEGIGPAVDSALLAARAIVDANDDYRSERLHSYDEEMARRLGAGGGWLEAVGGSRLFTVAVRLLIGRAWFVRRVVLDRWFLHRAER